jgi:hypothetical protein
VPREPPFDEKTGRPNFPATIFNDKEMYRMRKAFFYIHYAIKAGGIDLSKY